MSHYATLGVNKDADPATIKRAYRRKAKGAHPDRTGSHQAMVAVNRAYETLSDPEKRQRYAQTGEDGPQGPSIDQMAMQYICSLFSQMIDHAPDELDHVAKTVDSLVAKINETQQIMGEFEKQRSVIKKRIKLLKFKGKGRNPIRDFLEQRLTQIPEQIRAGEQQIKALERALEILKDYGWTRARTQTFTIGGSMFIFTGP